LQSGKVDAILARFQTGDCERGILAMLKLTPLSGALGAEVHELDLSRPLSPDLVAALREAFYEHVVLLFRGQALEAAQQIAFTEHFGKAEPHPLRTRRTVEGYPEVLILENQPGKPGARNDYWHSDISHAERPPLATLLHAQVVPPGKGDTMFCNMYRAWDQLSDGLKRMLDGTRAWHSAEATAKRNNLEHNDGQRIASVPPPRLHPVVRTNPETGRKALFVNPHFVTHLEHMTEAESKPLLDCVYRSATRPENVYRHHWQNGDLVIWDNRAAMHYAVRDYTPEDRRLMHRTTAAGVVVT
jgi:taurine dioxygenase